MEKNILIRNTLGISIVVALVCFIVFIISPLFGLPIFVVEMLQKNVAAKEEPALLNNLSGYLLHTTPRKIFSVNLEDKKINILKSNQYTSCYGSISGPSNNGKVVYSMHVLNNSMLVLNNQDSAFYQIRICNLDGSDDDAISGRIYIQEDFPKVSIYDNPILSIAISPDAKFLAYISGIKEKINKEDLHKVNFYNKWGVGEGRLEICKLPTMKKILEVPSVYGYGNISWLSDSNNLLFVSYEKNKHGIVKKLNIASGKIDDLAGDVSYQVLSRDGSILACVKVDHPSASYPNPKIKIKMVDLNSMKEVILAEPPDFIYLIGIHDPYRILYLGWTTGLPERYRNKITYGAKSLKITDIRNNHYATINILTEESGYGGGGDTESYGKVIFVPK